MSEQQLAILLLKADKNVQRDSEGDSVYRIHIKTCKDLIKEAYKQGREKGFKECQNSILKN